MSSRQGWPLLRGVLTSGVAFIEGYPHVRGGLDEGFHCIQEAPAECFSIDKWLQ